MPPKRRVVEASACDEALEQHGLRRPRDADAGVDHAEGQLVAGAPDAERDLADARELDRVRQQVQQHLAQPRRIAEPLRRAGDFPAQPQLQPLGLGLRLDHRLRALGERLEVEGRGLENQLAGLELGVVEDVVHQREQVLAAIAHRRDQFALLRGERRVEQQPGETDHAVERRADLVAHVGEEARLGVGRLARTAQRAPQLQLRDDLPPEAAQHLEGLGREVPRRVIDHAQRAERVAVRVDQRHAGVGADLRFAGDQRVVAEALVGTRIRHDQRTGFEDRVGAEREVARRLRRIQSPPRLEPLPMRVDQADQRDRRTAELRGERRKVIEPRFGIGVEDLVGLQRAEALLLVGRRGCGDHGGAAEVDGNETGDPSGYRRAVHRPLGAEACRVAPAITSGRES